MALVPQKLSIPLAAGLQQKQDPRAMELPGLTICVDAQFDEVGGLQTRYPFTTTGTGVTVFSDTVPPPTLSDIRRIVPNGNELLCFTKDTLYSWNAQLSKWVDKGTHLAVKLHEETVFATTGDQINTDRAELNGTVVYSWEEGPSGSESGYVAAVDSTTGSILMAPTSVAGSRLRLTALTTKIALSFYDGFGSVDCYMLDPADPNAAFSDPETVLSNAGVGTSAGPYFDIVKQPGADAAVFVVGASAAAAYTIGTIAADLTVTRTSKARNSVAPIAVSCEPTGASAQVIRGDGSDIRGDLITISTLADVYTAQAIGTFSGTLNQIAAAHRSTQDSSLYRCYAFWTAGQAFTTSGWKTKYNWVSTGNTLGTQADLAIRLSLASRAFDHDGRIYVWGVFAGAAQSADVGLLLYQAELQNSYFLYRDDAFLCAKAAAGKAAGFVEDQGFLGNVQSTGDGYAWCGGVRTRINLDGGKSNYSAREPRLVLATFDSDEARRCVRLGRTLYVTGGEILQYDGRQLAEVGFHVFPWNYSGSLTGASGLADGDYGIKSSYRWMNAAGETERSAAPVVGTTTVSGGPKQISVGEIPELNYTHKVANLAAIEVWRTAVNPTADSPFYLVTSPDPGATGSATNEYLENRSELSVEVVIDDYADATLISKETNPENGGYLESIAPPAATIIAASADRIFLAGVAGDPDRVWYSKLRNDGEIASFHETLTIAIPKEGGAITGLGFLNETLIVFRETAIYAIPGDGYDNTGGGGNYGPARILSTEVGATNHESIALEPGGLVFQSSKGKYRLNRGWAVDYIGAPVSDYDDEEVLSVHVVESQHQIRWLTSSRMLVLDYLVNQWAEWTVADAVHSCLWSGVHYVAEDAAVKKQQSTYTGVDYGIDIETAWIPLGQIQGFGRVWQILVLGEYRSAHEVCVRLARNYSDTYFQTKYWTVSPTTVGGPLQVKHGPSIQELQAIKIRLTATSTGVEGDPPDGEALKLTALALELGVERGLNRLPAAQTQ
jgi:hypothetical protein